MTLVFSLSNIFHSIERRLVYYWIQKIVCIRTTLYDWSSIAIFVKFRSFAFPFDRMWKKERSEKHGKAVKGADCESTSLTTRRPCPLCETDGQKDRSKAFDSTMVDRWQSNSNRYEEREEGGRKKRKVTTILTGRGKESNGNFNIYVQSDGKLGKISLRLDDIHRFHPSWISCSDKSDSL